MSTSVAIVVTVALGLIGVFGDFLLKLASGEPNPVANRHFVFGLIIYGSTAFGWVFVLRSLKLAYVGVFYSVTVIVFLSLVGVFFFDEKLRMTEWVGVLLAILSLILLYRVA